MSYQATEWASQQETGSPARKVLLFALARHADKRGRCWPSQLTLARATEQSLDTVQRQLRKLEASGHVKITKRRWKEGRWPRCEYQLNMCTDATEPQNAARQVSYESQQDDKLGSMRLGYTAMNTATGPQALRQEYSKNIQTENSIAPLEAQRDESHKAIKRTRQEIQELQQRIVYRLGNGNIALGWERFGELTPFQRADLEEKEARRAQAIKLGISSCALSHP